MAGTKRGMPFERTGPFPIDDTLVLSKTQMLAVSDAKMPEKYFAVCTDDGKLYVYDKSATASAETGKFSVVEGGDSHVELTQAEYDALTQEEKNNGTVYFVTDGQSGGGSAARNYTTTERKVGTYLGKDLYEITYTDITVPAYDPNRTSRHGAFLFNTLGFNDSWTIVNWEGVAQIVNTAIMCPLPMAYATRYEDSRTPKSDARAVGIFKFADGWTLYNTDVQPYTCKGLTLRYVKEVL